MQSIRPSQALKIANATGPYRSLAASGLDATRSKWEHHWATAVTDDDFGWLVNNARCNMIRLPIGYFTLGPSFCDNTPFSGDPAQVYVNGWSAVKTFVQRCFNHGIGVLIDLHAVPGGANGEIHSGTSSGRADLWGNAANLALAQRCHVFMAQEIASMDGVIGLQLCNEAESAAPGMYEWYDSVIGAINAVNDTLPIYLSDGWDLGPAITYIQRKNSQVSNAIIIDTHKYYTFSDFDRSQSPQQILGRLPGELGELTGKDGNVYDNGAASVFVGEYSCVLDQKTWDKVAPTDRPQLTKAFGEAQSRRWQQRASGSAFWTFKMDWMDGGDWGFKQQVDDGAIVPPLAFLISAQDVRYKLSSAASKRGPLLAAAVAAHVDFWTRTAPGQHFEHERFGRGWELAWGDALAFFRARVDGRLPGGGNGGDKLGGLDVWVQKRMGEAGEGKGQTAFGWEWEQGFRKGVGDFYGAVEV